MNVREKVKEQLIPFIGKINNIPLEKAIYKSAVNHSKKNNDTIPNIYKNISFEIFSILSQKTMKIKEIIETLKIGKILFDSPSFENIRQNQISKIKNLIEPEKVEKGVAKCKKCGCEEIYYFQRQSRSADEGMTSYFYCTGFLKNGNRCNNRWTE